MAEDGFIGRGNVYIHQAWNAPAPSSLSKSQRKKRHTVTKPPFMDKLPTHPPTVSAAAFRQWLGGRKRILVLTHERPDGDAFGALCAACAVLGRAGLDVVGYLKDPPARRYAFLPVPAQLRTAADFPSANPQLTTHNPQPALKEDAKTQRTPLLCASEPSVQSSVSPDFDGVFCLDCARAERLELPPGWDLARLHALPVLN